MSDTISIGTCECGHFPTQFIEEEGIKFNRHLVLTPDSKDTHINFNQELMCGDSEHNIKRNLLKVLMNGNP